MVQGPDSNLIFFNWWVFMHQYFSHINYGVLVIKRFSKHRKKCLWINLHLKESLFVQFFSFFFFLLNCKLHVFQTNTVVS